MSAECVRQLTLADVWALLGEPDLRGLELNDLDRPVSGYRWLLADGAAANDAGVEQLLRIDWVPTKAKLPPRPSFIVRDDARGWAWDDRQLGRPGKPRTGRPPVVYRIVRG